MDHLKSTFVVVCYFTELFEIFLARARDRIKVFSEPDTDDSEEGKIIYQYEPVPFVLDGHDACNLISPALRQ